MQIEQLNSFLVTYRIGNISEASKQLYISQQGLSRQIRSLEQNLGVELFERSRSGVSPTEIADQLYQHFEQSYAHYSEGMKLIDNIRNEKENSLKIAFCNGISRGLNSGFLVEYQETFPSGRLEIQELPKQLCIEQLKQHEIDMAFLINPFDPRMFTSWKIGEGYMYIAMHKTHPLAKETAPISLSCLNGQKIITGTRESSLTELFDYYCQFAHIKPNIISASSYSLEQVNNMKRNTGIATLTPGMVKQVNNPSVVIHLLQVPEPCRLYCCVAKDKSLSPELHSLYEYIKEYFSPVPVLL